ncbi:MAG: PIG-L family deacetylase [Chloroflexota bacterium]|nr:MAG: LmbE family protein [Chloroflexota bacterium]
MSHLMVVGAHISDAENMAGAVMLKHKRAGWDISIVHVTAGDKGHPTLSPEEYNKMRMADAQASAEFIGASYEVLPYKDGELEVNEETTWAVADLIRKYRPTVIITHWKGSLHTDHTNTYEIVHKALFKAGLQAFRREYPAHYPSAIYYSENWEDMEGYSADIYLDVSDVFDDYLKLLKTHALMRENYASFRYYDYYEALGVVRGCLGGFRRAVTLMQPHSLYRYERRSGLLVE